MPKKAKKTENPDKSAKVERVSGRFAVGSAKPKNSGRKKGTPNKRTQNLIELIEKKFPNFDPIISLIEISQDNETPLELKVNCLKEIAKYIHPQRKAVEIAANSDNEISTKVIFLQHLKDLGQNAD